MNKKVWQKPILIVLVRSKPEETVLVACKTSAHTGPESAYAIVCLKSGDLPLPECQDCYTWTAT